MKERGRHVQLQVGSSGRSVEVPGVYQVKAVRSCSEGCDGEKVIREIAFEK